MSALVEKLHSLFEPAVNSSNCVLWGVEYISQGKNSILRVYVDATDGVSIDDCATISHQLSGILDVYDPIAGEYNLEVSSPGMDRPFFSPEQYLAYIGENITIRTNCPVQERRNFTGSLVSANENEVTIIENDQEITLPCSVILRSHLVPTFD